MLPLLGAAATGALSAGMKGVQNFVSGEEQEEQAKKQALKNLSNRFQAGTGGMTFASAPEIPKAPSFAETVVAPMAQSAVSNAAGSALSGAMTPDKVAGSGPLKGMSENTLGGLAGEDRNDTWYRKAAREQLGRR